MRKLKCGKSSPTLLQGAGLYIAKLTKTHFFNKMQKVNKFPNYYYKALGNYIILKREIKINARKEIRIEYARALDPLKKLNEIKKAN